MLKAISWILRSAILRDESLDVKVKLDLPGRRKSTRRASL
jgi:hypothetical protein